VSQPKFDELLQSPLNEPSRSRWWPVVLGGLIGAVATAAILMATGSNDPEDDSPAALVPTPSTTTITVPQAESSSFPPGYVAVSDTEAFKPHHVATAEDQIVVTMTTSYARDLDPTTQPWFLGGTWMLDTTSGASIVSEATLFDDDVPGGFSVVFPVLPGTIVEPQQLRLVERWEPMQSTATVDVRSVRIGPVGVLVEPLLVPMDGFGLRFDQIWIPNIESGDARWALDGDPQPRGLVSLTVEMMGPDEQLIATGQPWAATIRPFGLDASQGTSGFAVIPNQPGYLDTAEKAQAFMAELELVDHLIIHCTVTTGDSQRIDEVVFSLPMSD
jgi:hypothetical protein